MKETNTFRQTNFCSFKGITPKIVSPAFIAPTATLIGDVDIACGASVWFGSILRGDLDRIQVGEDTNIQDLTVCHTDKGMPLSIGKRVTVGHRCVLHGCTIKDDCLIGMGAIVMNGAVVGRGSVVAAGATILEKTVVPPFSLVAGVPGKIKRSFPEAEVLSKIAEAARVYKDLAGEYLSGDEFFPEK